MTTEYRLNECQRAEVVRAFRRSNAAMRDAQKAKGDLDTLIETLAERLHVPWHNADLDLETGKYSPPTKTPTPTPTPAPAKKP